MIPPPPKALALYLQPYSRVIRDLAIATRALVLEEMQPCTEFIYDAYNAVALGYGPNDRIKYGVCHIAVYPKYVNIGFNRGAEMDDPAGLLLGTGKTTRHIRIEKPEDLARPEIRDYVRRARAGMPEPESATSVVKGASPKKRRP